VFYQGQDEDAGLGDEVENLSDSESGSSSPTESSSGGTASNDGLSLLVTPEDKNILPKANSCSPQRYLTVSEFCNEDYTGMGSEDSEDSTEELVSMGSGDTSSVHPMDETGLSCASNTESEYEID